MDSSPFVWLPGQGIDQDALERLHKQFPRPGTAMGEAWFMGNRRMFHELMGDLDALSARQLQEPFEEIASGTANFGAMAEWNDWYHFLLAQLLPRSHEHFVTPLLEPMVTGFMAIYPNHITPNPYKEFENDVLRTLGRCLMEPACWNGNEVVVGRFLHRSNDNPNQVWCWWDASGDFSASMFFCLKYLPASALKCWIDSVFAIPDPHWRAQVIVWLVGAYPILSGQMAWPSSFSAGARPCVRWEWYNCLDDKLGLSLLPPTASATMLSEAKAFFNGDVFRHWIASVNSIPYLAEELAEIPGLFQQLFVTSDDRNHNCLG